MIFLQLQELTTSDLFIRYLARLTEEYPYIRLNTDNSSTTIISLGYECADKKKEISCLKFLPFEKYPIRIDFQEVQTHFSVTQTICTITKPTEMLLETKAKLTVSEIVYPELLSLYNVHLELYSNNELSNFLATHKRVVLEVFPNDFSQGKGRNVISAVMLRTTSQYNSSRNFPSVNSEMTKIGKQFKTCAEQIRWALPREENLDFFILREDEKYSSTIYEIINKDF